MAKRNKAPGAGSVDAKTDAFIRTSWDPSDSDYSAITFVRNLEILRLASCALSLNYALYHKWQMDPVTL